MQSSSPSHSVSEATARGTYTYGPMHAGQVISVMRSCRAVAMLHICQLELMDWKDH